MRRALVRYLHWYQTKLIPEFEVDGGRCDLVQISRADYITEFEIKISRADWNADRDKAKWTTPRPHIARFFYVVPKSLVEPVERIPDWLPDYAGILVVSGDGVGFDQVRELRAARRRPAVKAPPELLQRGLEAFYYRYWRHEDNMERVRSELREQRRRCPKCYGRMHCGRCETKITTPTDLETLEGLLHGLPANH